MPLYLMLTTLTEKGVQTLNSNPGRVREVNRDIEELGAKIVHQWASIGEYDFVNIVEAPNDVTLAKLSVVLGALLHSQSDTGLRVGVFLSELVLSPLLYLGGALLYVDQAARVGTTRAERLAVRVAPRDSAQ